MSNALELLLRKAGRELSDYQVCRLFKVPEEMQQTPVDFFGYSNIGRAILIEAKMVNRSSLPIGSEPGLSVHQWNELEAANKAGALALICWARGSDCATLSFDLAAKLAEGRRSIPWSLIEAKYLRSMRGEKCHLTLLDHWLPLAGCP